MVAGVGFGQRSNLRPTAVRVRVNIVAGLERCRHDCPVTWVGTRVLLQLSRRVALVVHLDVADAMELAPALHRMFID